MKNHCLKTVATLCCAIISLAGCASGTEKLYAYDTSAYFGTFTRWAFSAQSEKEAKSKKQTWQTVTSRFAEVERAVSAEVEESAISRFNRADAGEKVELDAITYSLLQTAKKVYTQSEGAYDPTVGLLVDLWGFSPRFTKYDYAPTEVYDRAQLDTLPEEKYIQAFRELSDFSSVTLLEEEGKYYALKPSCVYEVKDGEGNVVSRYTMQINLGGIGKGYAVDEGKKLVSSQNAYGYLSLAGSSMYMFSNPTTEDGAWNVGVINPRTQLFAQAEYLSVNVKNVGLSTSGDYERFFVKGGKRYCHIIDPATGYPVNASPENERGEGIVMASVIGLDGAEGDATSTALIVMGKERAIAYTQRYLQDKSVFFVYYDGIDYTVYAHTAGVQCELKIPEMKWQEF